MAATAQDGSEKAERMLGGGNVMGYRHATRMVPIVILAVTAPGCLGGGSSGSGGGDSSVGGAGGDPVLAGSSARACLNAQVYTTGSALEALYRVTFESQRETELGGSHPFDADIQSISEVEFGEQVLGAAIFGVKRETAVETLGSAWTRVLSYEVNGEPATPPDDFGGVARSFQDVDIQAGRIRSFGNITEDQYDGGPGIVAELNDPYLLDRYDLQPGGSYEQTYRQVSLELEGGTPLYEIDSSSADGLTIVRHVTYNGQEAVTVPAGTFDACRFTITEQIPSPMGGVNVESRVNWVAVGHGVLLRSEDVEGDAQRTANVTWELIDAEIDGVTIE